MKSETSLESTASNQPDDRLPVAIVLEVLAILSAAAAVILVAVRFLNEEATTFGLGYWIAASLLTALSLWVIGTVVMLLHRILETGRAACQILEAQRRELAPLADDLRERKEAERQTAKAAAMREAEAKKETFKGDW
jgi:hypothetical protein